MSNRRSLIILFSIIALSFLLLTSYIGNQRPGASFVDQSRAAFNGEGSISMLAPAEHTLHVAVSLTVQEYRSLREWADRYEERYPNVRVVVDNVRESEAFRRFTQAAELNGDYDIVLLDNDWTYRFATAGLLAPLPDGLIPDLDNRLPVGLAHQVQWNGFTWAVPTDLDPYVLVYNPDILAQLGWGDNFSFQEIVNLHFAAESADGGAESAAEEKGASADEADAAETDADVADPKAVASEPGAEPVVAAGSGFVRNEGETGEADPAAADSASSELALDYGLAFDLTDPYAAAALLSAVGALASDESGRGLRVVSDEALDLALRWFEDLAREVRSGSAGESILGLSDTDAVWKLLAEGRAAMRIAALSDYVKNGSDFAVRLLPGMTESVGPSLWTRGRSWAVLAKSPNAEAAFHLIEALTEDQVQLSWASAAGRLPASETALLSVGVWPADLTRPWFRSARAFPASPDYMDKLARYRLAVLSLGTTDGDLNRFRTTIPQIWTPASSSSI